MVLCLNYELIIFMHATVECGLIRFIEYREDEPPGG